MFGGSSGDAYLKHIDVFDDYLAFTGMTSDDSLTSINYEVPYLALASI
jgi:hypothetical protein